LPALVQQTLITGHTGGAAALWHDPRVALLGFDSKHRRLPIPLG
jgi:hypothetical protein